MGVCVDDGWLKQPHLADSDLTLGLGEAAHLLCIDHGRIIGHIVLMYNIGILCSGPLLVFNSVVELITSSSTEVVHHCQMA